MFSKRVINRIVASSGEKNYTQLHLRSSGELAQ